MNAPAFIPALLPRIRYLSVCSGIEAAAVAWEPLGWAPVAFAEVDAFPSRVLARRWPHVPNLGDFTAIDVGAIGPVDLLVGGTPCQDFSVAGLGASLAGAHGNLTLAFADLAHALALRSGLRWTVWENVPGVLSRPDNAFGFILARFVGGDDALPLPRGVERWPDAGMVAGPRARAAWRVLDAQHFGLAQRRRRVFLVVGFGERADPAAVLFERAGLRRHPPARGEAGQGAAGALGAGLDRGGTLQDARSNLLIAHSLRADGFDASEDGTGRGTPLVPVCFDTTQITSRENRCDPHPGDPCHPLAAGAHPPAIAFTCKDHGQHAGAISPTLRAMAGGHANASGQMAVATSWAVRRLTPTECHRLQGFPDDHAAIPGAADGPIYKALGNSMPVPCMAWIGRRIEAQERREAA